MKVERLVLDHSLQQDGLASSIFRRRSKKKNINTNLNVFVGFSLQISVVFSSVTGLDGDRDYKPSQF